MSIPTVLDTTWATRGSTPSASAFSHAGASNVAPPPTAPARNPRLERAGRLLFPIPLIVDHADERVSTDRIVGRTLANKSIANLKGVIETVASGLTPGPDTRRDQVAVAIPMVLCPYARAQGGPPYYTNDTSTPGNRNWEINLGYMPFLYATQSTSHLPDVDINYGIGDRFQLTYENAWLRVGENSHRQIRPWAESIRDEIQVLQ